MRAKVVIALFGALFAASSLSALTVDELDVNVGLIYIGTTDPNALGPSIITPLYGVSLPMQLSGPFFIEPMIEFYTTFYRWTGTAVAPAAMESGDGFLTLGALLSMHGGVRYALSPVLSAGGSLGIDFLLRFPIEFLMADQNSTANTSAGLGWFYGAARFIYPEVRGFLKWQVTDSIGLVFNLRAWVPAVQALGRQHPAVSRPVHVRRGNRLRREIGHPKPAADTL